MKRLLGLLALFLVFGAVTDLGVLPAISRVEAQQQDPAKITVFITKTGEKYHRDGCRYLRQSKISTTLREAVARGYEACSVCKPPQMQASH